MDQGEGGGGVPVQTIAFLGAGNMTEAIIKGVLGVGLLQPEALIASDIVPERRMEISQKYKIRTTPSNREAAAEGEIVLLGVKPYRVDVVLAEVGSLLPGKILVSVAAGIPLARLTGFLSQEVAVIRAMPNAAALVLAAATAIAAGPEVDSKRLDQVVTIFESIGRVWVLEEIFLDAVTGLSGSGPAFVMMVIEAMAEGGVKCGLPYPTALSMAAQTVFGAGKWLLETSGHPAQLKNFVTSPGGTTAAGLHPLEAGSVRAAFISAVEAATRRSKELGQKERE